MRWRSGLIVSAVSRHVRRALEKSGEALASAGLGNGEIAKRYGRSAGLERSAQEGCQV